MTVSGIWEIPALQCFQGRAGDSGSPLSPLSHPHPFPEHWESQVQTASSSEAWHVSISQRTKLGGPMSHSVVCHGRSTSSRYFIKQVTYWYQSSDGQSLPIPTHCCTFAGDDTSPCDWGADESKLVSALQGAICGWRNPGWDWWVSLHASSRATVLDYELLYQMRWAPERLLAPLRGCPQQQTLRLRYRRADIHWVLQHSQSK